MSKEEIDSEEALGTDAVSEAKPARAKRLSKLEWAEAEELYKAGHTASQVAEQFGITPAAVSLHMKSRSIKGGEKVDRVQKEIAAQILLMQRQFAEKKQERQIKAQEQLYSMVQALLAAYFKDFRRNQGDELSLGAMSNSAKSLKDGLLALKVAREELYTILGIDPDDNKDDEAPQLVVREMTPEEEEALRQAKGGMQADEEELAEMVNQLAEGADDIEVLD